MTLTRRSVGVMTACLQPADPGAGQGGVQGYRSDQEGAFDNGKEFAGHEKITQVPVSGRPIIMNRSRNIRLAEASDHLTIRPMHSGLWRGVSIATTRMIIDERL